MEKSESGRILIFGKDVEFMTSLREILSKVGYAASVSTLWENAFEALKNQSFDLFLTDIEVPDMDGIAVIRAAMKIDPHLGRAGTNTDFCRCYGNWCI